MQVFIIDNGSNYTDDLKHLFKNYRPHIIPYGEINQTKISDKDVVVLSGGHSLPVLWHKDSYQKEYDLINNHRGPLIGVCLGFQLIAHHYGSQLHLLDTKRHGLLGIRPKEDDHRKVVQVYESHHWAAPKVKKPLVELARSVDGVEIFKHESLPIFGFQFHPESSYDKGGKELFTEALKDIIEL